MISRLWECCFLCSEGVLSAVKENTNIQVIHRTMKPSMISSFLDETFFSLSKPTDHMCMFKTGSSSLVQWTLCLALHANCPKQQHIYKWYWSQDGFISSTVFVIFDQWIIFPKTITRVIILKVLLFLAPLWHPLRLCLCYEFVIS